MDRHFSAAQSQKLFGAFKERFLQSQERYRSNKEYENMIGEIARPADSQQAKIDHLQAEVEGLQENEKVLTKENRSLTAEVARLKSHTHESQDNYEHLCLTVSDYRRKVREGHGAFVDKDENLSEVKQLRRALQDFQKEGIFMRKQNESISYELAQFKSLTAKRNNENIKLKKAVEELMNQIGTQRSDLQQSVCDGREQLETRQEEQVPAGHENVREERCTDPSQNQRGERLLVNNVHGAPSKMEESQHLDVSEFPVELTHEGLHKEMFRTLKNRLPRFQTKLCEAKREQEEMTSALKMKEQELSEARIINERLMRKLQENGLGFSEKENMIAEGDDTTPAHETGESVPEHETGESVPEHETGESVPEHETGESVPEHETYESVPVDKTGESVPEHETGESVPEHETGESVPEHETGESVPVHETGESVPEESALKAPAAEGQTKSSWRRRAKCLLKVGLAVGVGVAGALLVMGLCGASADCPADSTWCMLQSDYNLQHHLFGFHYVTPPAL